MVGWNLHDYEIIFIFLKLRGALKPVCVFAKMEVSLHILYCKDIIIVK